MNQDSPLGKSELIALLNRMIDAGLDEAEWAQLEAMLQEDPDAQDEYLNHMALHAALYRELEWQHFEPIGKFPAAVYERSSPVVERPTAEPFDEDYEPIEEQPVKWYRRRSVVITIACAASLLILLSGQLFSGAYQYWTEPIATLTKSSNARFMRSSRQIRIGQTLPRRTLQLQSGIAAFRFTSGTEAIIQGPAVFRLTSPNRLTLRSGKLAAIVPPQAIGFAVDTPHGQIVDLGTEFGAEVSPDGTTRVHVFKGRVVAKANDDASASTRLTEQQAAQLSSEGAAVKPIDFSAEAFSAPMALSRGVNEMAGSVEFMCVLPSPLVDGSVQSNQYVRLIPERHGTILTEEVPVDFVEAGTYHGSPETATGSVAAGSEVDAYLLHFDTITESGPPKTYYVRGSLTFEGEILGVITTQDRIRAQDAVFSRLERPELWNDLETSDEVTISDDQHTISFYWNGGSGVENHRRGDQIRILVRSQATRLQL